MKRIIVLMLASLAVFACETYDDSAIWEKLESDASAEKLQTLCNQINTNITALGDIVIALKEGQQAESLVKIMDNGKDAGYMITFPTKKSIALYHWTDVMEGYTPCIGVRPDASENYYWVLDGSWIRDDLENRIPVMTETTKSASIPIVRMEEDGWYMSVDKGVTWSHLQSPIKGEESCSLFQNIDVSESTRVLLTLNDGTKLHIPIKQDAPAQGSDCECDPYDPWDGYTDPDVYEEQDIINLTNALMANMYNCNLATRHIMDIAYNFWKRRGEFIYCSNTAKDKPWDYWSYVGYKDGNTGFTVGAGHGGYKRIDCSTFVSYVINGIDYYSTPYFNALEWTTVTKGALTSAGAETSSSDATICRSGKIYLRHGKKHILESASSSKYKFNKIFAYDKNDKVIQTLTGKTSFTLPSGAEYIRVEMKVSAASNYAPAVKGVSPAAILKCLRIRENETLSVVAGCPERYTREMSKWFDDNGYGLEEYKDYNPLYWEDSDFQPGTVVFMGKEGSSGYKNITHVTLYIGGGYIMHSQAPRGLLGGEGIMIDKLKDMELRYSRPFCSAATPKYHSNYDEEKANLQ